MSLHETTFTWDHPGNEVIVTGSFDQWSSSVTLSKDESGKFVGKAKIPWSEKTTYKFVVDGNWVIDDSQPTETDESGNLNNVIVAPVKQHGTTASGIFVTVASGIGAATNALVGVDPFAQPDKIPLPTPTTPREFNLPEWPIAVPPVTDTIKEEPAKEEASTANGTAESTPDPPAVVPAPIVVNNAESNQPAVASVPDTTTDSEAHTHTPVTFSKAKVNVEPKSEEVVTPPVEPSPKEEEETAPVTPSPKVEDTSTPAVETPAPVVLSPKAEETPALVEPSTEEKPAPVEATPAPVEKVEETPATQKAEETPAAAIKAEEITTVSEPTLAAVSPAQEPKEEPVNEVAPSAPSQEPIPEEATATKATNGASTPPAATPSSLERPVTPKQKFPSSSDSSPSSSRFSTVGSTRKKRNSILKRVTSIFHHKDKDKEQK